MDRRHDEDEDLRQAFGELRRSDAARAPSFQAVLTRPPADARRRRVAPLLGRAAAAAALAASVAVGLLARRPPAAPPVMAFAAWTAPTDFLLRTPGSDVLATVPRIGAPRALPAVDSFAEGAPSKRRSPSP